MVCFLYFQRNKHSQTCYINIIALACREGDTEEWVFPNAPQFSSVINNDIKMKDIADVHWYNGIRIYSNYPETITLYQILMMRIDTLLHLITQYATSDNFPNNIANSTHYPTIQSMIQSDILKYLSGSCTAAYKSFKQTICLREANAAKEIENFLIESEESSDEACESQMGDNDEIPLDEGVDAKSYEQYNELQTKIDSVTREIVYAESQMTNLNIDSNDDEKKQQLLVHIKKLRIRRRELEDQQSYLAYTFDGKHFC